MTDQSTGFYYLTEEQPCPYLPGRRERKLYTRLRPGRGRDDFDTLLKKGFRRSQNIAYQPRCEGCGKCVSVRVRADLFDRSRSQKRVWRRNQHLLARRRPAIATPEQYRLFHHYVETRHGAGGMAGMTVMDYMVMVEDSVVDTFMTEYRLPADHPHTGREPFFSERMALWEDEGPLFPDMQGDKKEPLVGAALCDRLSDGISLVYSFFEPAMASQSLGTYIILEHLAYAKSCGLPHVYLGYWVEGSPKMAYKTRFQPQEHLTPAGWQPGPC